MEPNKTLAIVRDSDSFPMYQGWSYDGWEWTGEQEPTTDDLCMDLDDPDCEDVCYIYKLIRVVRVTSPTSEFTIEDCSLEAL